MQWVSWGGQHTKKGQRRVTLVTFAGHLRTHIKRTKRRQCTKAQWRCGEEQ